LRLFCVFARFTSRSLCLFSFVTHTRLRQRSPRYALAVYSRNIRLPLFHFHFLRLSLSYFVHLLPVYGSLHLFSPFPQFHGCRTPRIVLYAGFRHTQTLIAHPNRTSLLPGSRARVFAHGTLRANSLRAHAAPASCAATPLVAFAQLLVNMTSRSSVCRGAFCRLPDLPRAFHQRIFFGTSFASRLVAVCLFCRYAPLRHSCMPLVWFSPAVTPPSRGFAVVACACAFALVFFNRLVAVAATHVSALNICAPTFTPDTRLHYLVSAAHHY